MDSEELGWLDQSQCQAMAKGNGPPLIRRTSHQGELCSPQNGIDIEMREVESLLQILFVDIDRQFAL